MSDPPVAELTTTPRARMAVSREGVPSYEITELHAKTARYCVCVFVINEGEKIMRQLARMQSLGLSCDVIIADGGSTDGVLAPERLRELGVRALLVKTGVGRLSAQMRMAFDYALHEGYDGIVTIDGNDKDDPSAIVAFIRALEAGADHVQGSRFVPGGRAVNTPRNRYWGIRLLHAPLISLAARHRYTDTTNGFRAYSRRLLLDPRVAPFRDVFARYELHYYLAIRAPRLGYRVSELPVTRTYPAHGPVPTKIRGIRGNLLVLRTLWRAVRHRFDP